MDIDEARARGIAEARRREERTHRRVSRARERRRVVPGVVDTVGIAAVDAARAGVRVDGRAVARDVEGAGLLRVVADGERGDDQGGVARPAAREGGGLPK
eukprot:2760871-Prymnesium_polylepis.1